MQISKKQSLRSEIKVRTLAIPMRGKISNKEIRAIYKEMASRIYCWANQNNEIMKTVIK